MWICLYKMWLLYKSNVGITARKVFVFRKVNSLVPGATRRVQKNTQYQQATPLDCHTGFLSVSPAAACQGDIVNIGLHFILKNVRPYAAPCSEA